LALILGAVLSGVVQPGYRIASQGAAALAPPSFLIVVSCVAVRA
jgi:hypothetical protein